jgi:hypothetical protein
MLARTATGLRSTFASITAPCSVKTYGRYLIFHPRFKVAICDLERRTAFPSSNVS